VKEISKKSKDIRARKQSSQESHGHLPMNNSTSKPRDSHQDSIMMS